MRAHYIKSSHSLYDPRMIIRQIKAFLHYIRGFIDFLRWITMQKVSYSVAHHEVIFLSTSQRGRTNEFDSKQLLSGNYPGIMYHHVITPDKIQSL